MVLTMTVATKTKSKSTTISESKYLTTMTVATLVGKLREYELELGRLKDEEEIDKKKRD